jgi:hypothetical protein
MSVTFYSDNRELELNVNNSNACALLSALDIAPDYCGAIVGVELAARADAALRVLSEIDGLDSAIPSYEDRAPGMCTMIECGRRDGYMTDRLTTLRKLGLDAGENEVYWS